MKSRDQTSVLLSVPHFWVSLLGAIANPPKSEDKYVEKVFNWSEVYLSEMTCYKIHTFREKMFLKNPPKKLPQPFLSPHPRNPAGIVSLKETLGI